MFKLLIILILCAQNALAVDTGLFISVIECESGGNSRNIHGKPLVGDEGKARSIAQFHENTFNELAKKAHMKNMHWLNPVDQMRLLAWALDNGYGDRWTCYRKLTHTGEFKVQEMRNY